MSDITLVLKAVERGESCSLQLKMFGSLRAGSAGALRNPRGHPPNVLAIRSFDANAKLLDQPVAKITRRGG